MSLTLLHQNNKKSTLSANDTADNVVINFPNINAELTTSGSYYITQAQVLQYVATNGGQGTDLIFDSNGNLYWAIINHYNSSYNLTSYVYKITPSGSLSTFASVTTNGAIDTRLKFDNNGNLYWAIANRYNGPYNLTSYVYKITPGGSLSTFASQATSGAYQTDLIFDNDDNLYWAITNYYNGSAWALTSYVYKITSNGTKTTFASVATTGAAGSSLVFDNTGNLYWAITNHYNGSTYNLTSYVYKITPSGSLTTVASVDTNGGFKTSLVLDNSGNLYWAITNSYNGSIYNFTSYVYKITSSGSLSTFASSATNGAHGTSLVFDSSGNLYWAVANHYSGSSYNTTSYVYKITPSGSMNIFSSVSINGPAGTSLIFDNNGNLYWAIAQYYTGSSYSTTSYVYTISKMEIE